ncbi:hypothetical protein QN355_09020 [Cryobacterium sp. 10S3]|uniref:hypothetical protein n=1 Tax=unclassified Cryobacterium TaxID=2649013 RepID=UPI002AC8AC13|nr:MULTISPECIES: hypothetical protein [unclassified Cryobacterium]MEB0001659.1 hypothetical protein [Cryobacterium sp. RTC2.1]MEB0286690.1 hypothetical protein [Cryobacterium sp. 10S3]WPX13189.1 hypothetical protein RHM57_16190 [Cryobacterium sp. 10S3]
MTAARRTILIGSSALLVTALLSGCSLSGGDLGGLIPTSGTPAALSDTATPIPTALAGDTNGDGKLSEFEKQILAQNAPKDYTLADGTVVSIDPKQPLPAAVVAEVRAAISPATTSLADSSPGNDGTGKRQAILDALDAQAAVTGKGIVVVTGVTSASPTPGGPELDGWIALASSVHFTGIMFTQDKSAMVAAVQAWAASRGFEFLLME